MRGPEVRPALVADLEVVAELEDELFGAEAWDDESLVDELERPGRTFLVAVVDDEVVGYAITMSSGDIVDLVRIGVHPGRQREGIARELLERLLELAAEESVDRMLLEVSASNREAIAFYAANDFQQIDSRSRYYKDGSDALVMKRSLGPTCNWSTP